MMKKIKFLLFLIPFVTLFVATYLGYENYKSKKPNEIDKVCIGYIEKSEVKFDSIKEYAKESIYGTYSSTAPRIYKGSKYQFKKHISENYTSEAFDDNGYLVLRFYINHKGEVFLHDTIELNHAYEAFDLNDSLVNQLTALSFRKGNWNPFGDNKNNYYMHLTYRIENGKITEIIP
tara:strand:+ start:121 stop:648 length:528 start_codon:yes stop_codon:yes gene_type:complete